MFGGCMTDSLTLLLQLGWTTAPTMGKIPQDIELVTMCGWIKEV